MKPLVNKKRLLFWMAILYLLMTLINTLLLYPTGLGSNLPLLGLIFFGGFGFSLNILHLIMSIILFFGSITLWIYSYWQLFKKRKYTVYCFALKLDIIIFTIWTVVSFSFDFLTFFISLLFCVSFCRIQKAESYVASDTNQKTE